MTRPKHFPRETSGSALISTLLMVVVLTIIVTAFMQSMAVERRTANSYKNKLQAGLLGDSALNEAVSRLWKTTSHVQSDKAFTNRDTGPYASVYFYDPQATKPAPYLFYAKRILEKPDSTELITHRVPLFSTRFLADKYFDAPAALPIDTNSFTLDDIDNAGSPAKRNVTSSTDILCNLNANWKLYDGPLVGLSAPEIPVNWIYVKDSNGRIVGRYAFWTDDESSKLDMRTAGNVSGTGGMHSRSSGVNLDEVSLSFMAASGVGIPGSSLKPSLAELRNLIGYKDAQLPVSNPSIARYKGAGDALDDNELWSALRPYLTVYSLEDDRSPNGTRKINLNTLVTDTDDPSRIREEVLAISATISNNLPQFGERYYSEKLGVASTPSELDKGIYVKKIATNIRDFIDPDPTATTILPSQDDEVISAPVGNFVPYELISDELPIIGKEKGPFLSEYVRVARVITPHLSEAGTITFRLGHYIELQNLTNKTVTYADLGPEPFLMLSNRQTWRQTGITGTPDVLRPVDIKIKLPQSFSIPPFGFAVVTTDGPPFQNSQSTYLGPANSYKVTRGEGLGQWSPVDAGGQSLPDAGSSYEDYTITTEVDVDSKGKPTDRYDFQVGVATPSYALNRERLIFANEDGLIDCALRIYTVSAINLGQNARNPSVLVTFPADSNTSSRNTRNNSNTEPRLSREDARSNTEIYALGNNAGSSWKAGGTVYGNAVNINQVSGTFQQTLGAVNYNSDAQPTLTGVNLWRRGWREFTQDPAGNHFITDRDIRAIGELGWIYDPS
ncbi:MAG: PilX N-terminal domain-containing pilus assembly protein, partial [Chthoniobacterales bacterium]